MGTLWESAGVDLSELVDDLEQEGAALDEIVAAHRLVDSGRKRGNVVVMVRPEAGERPGREAVPKTTTS